MMDADAIVEWLEDQHFVYQASKVHDTCVVVVRKQSAHDNPASFPGAWGWRVGLYQRIDTGDLIVFVPQEAGP